MIQLDTATVAIIVTILLALFSLAAAWGALMQKVKRHDIDIERECTERKDDMARFRAENRDDHQSIFNKLDDISKYLRNGKTNGGS